MIELFLKARKYHLGVILAYQYLGQLPEELWCALLDNVGTLMAFRLGGRDAEVLGADFTRGAAWGIWCIWPRIRCA